MIHPDRLYNQQTSLSILVDRLSIRVDWPTNIPAYLSRLTDRPTYQPIYLGWLTKQHTIRSIWVEWPTNIPDYLSQLNDWPTYPTIYPGWLTNQHTGLSVWFDWPTNIPVYPCQHTSLSLQADWPPNIPDIIISIRETYQPIHQGWLTNIPDYLSGMTDQPTYLTLRVDWLTNTPAFLSGLTDWQTYPTIYPYWNVCIVSWLPVHAYYPPSYKGWLTSAFLFCLLIIISAYLSSYLPTYQGWLTTYQGRLTDHHPVTYVYIFGLTAFQSDWPSCLCSYPAYLSGLTTDQGYRKPIFCRSRPIFSL